jgi:hypothetical protein
MRVLESQSRFLDLAGNHRAAFSIVLIGNQIAGSSALAAAARDAVMYACEPGIGVPWDRCFPGVQAMYRCCVQPDGAIRCAGS